MIRSPVLNRLPAHVSTSHSSRARKDTHHTSPHVQDREQGRPRSCRLPCSSRGPRGSLGGARAATVKVPAQDSTASTERRDVIYTSAGSTEADRHHAKDRDSLFATRRALALAAAGVLSSSTLGDSEAAAAQGDAFLWGAAPPARAPPPAPAPSALDDRGLWGRLFTSDPLDSWEGGWREPEAGSLTPTAELLLAELRGRKQMRSTGQVWSKALNALEPPVLTPPVAYPGWLDGIWDANFKFKEAKFPRGVQFANDRVAGYRIASILALPNVGANVTHRLRFAEVGSAGAGGAAGAGASAAAAVVEDAEFNLRERFAAYWSDAELAEVQAAPGKLRVAYAGPTASSRARRLQHVQASQVYGESAYIDLNTFVTSEVFAQNALEQGLVTLYQVVTLYQLMPDGSVQGAQRLGGFLEANDPQYYDADGYAVSNYIYNFKLETADNIV